jgi:hypothetical protein
MISRHSRRAGFRAIARRSAILLGFLQFRALFGSLFFSGFLSLFGAGFSGRTFDESAAKIEGGHGSWLADRVQVTSLAGRDGRCYQKEGGSQVHVCNRPICRGGRLMVLVWALCFRGGFRTLGFQNFWAACA